MEKTVRVLTASDRTLAFETYSEPFISMRQMERHWEESARSIYEMLYSAVPSQVHDRVRNLLVSGGAHSTRFVAPTESQVNQWNADLSGTRVEDGFPDTPFQIWLAEHEACHTARHWVGDRTFRQVYEDITHGEANWAAWLLDTLRLKRPGIGDYLGEAGFLGALKGRYPYEDLKEKMGLEE